MNIQLSSIEQAPSSVPNWHLMMDDLCQPPARRVAKVLGLSLRSIQRYNATGYAPRHVCLAIFWLTNWGRSAVHCQAHNDAVMLAQLVRGLNDQIEQLTGRVDHLLSVGDFGSANEPGDAPRSLPGRRYDAIR